MSTAAVTPARPGTVLADLLPSPTLRAGGASTRVRDLALVLGGAALTGLAAQIAVPVPGSPVPVTGQTFAALLVGTTLGARRGVSSSPSTPSPVSPGCRGSRAAAPASPSLSATSSA